MATLDTSQKMDTSECDELHQDHSDKDEHEKEDASKNVADESDDDEKGDDGAGASKNVDADEIDDDEHLSRKDDEAGDSDTKRRCKIENDDDEYDLTKYDGTCDKCGGRTCPEVDHIEDLIERMATSKHPLNSTCRLQYHWPHFADINRLMQFLCPICRLHFRGAGEFTVHTVRNKTEDGFKKDGPEQITWTEEIGVQHEALLKTFILLIKDIDSNGPKAEQIPIIDKFLCCNGQRYFEVAHRQGKFANIPLLPNLVDYEDEYMTQMEYELRLVTNDNPEAFKIEEVDDSDLQIGGDVYRQQLDDVFFGKVAKLSDITEKQDADCVNEAKKVKRDDKSSPKKTSQIRDLFTCPCCSETSPSVRHHINDAMWSTKRKRSNHVNYFVKNLSDSDINLSDYDVKSTTTFYCPACKRHVRTWRSLEFLYNHFQKHAWFPKMQPNKFTKDHMDVIHFTIELFVERIKGDISSETLRATLYEKLQCTEGGVYLDSDKIMDQNNWQKSKGFAPRRHRQQQQQRHRSGGKRYHPDYAAAKKMRGASGRRPSFGDRPHGGPMRMGATCVCDLCGFQTFRQDDLHNHLMGALFWGNRESTKAHLFSFPKHFLYNIACKCPACGIEESNFVNCLQHIGRVAKKTPQHKVEAEALVNQFLRCMTGAINLNGVTRYIEGSFQMGGRRK